MYREQPAKRRKVDKEARDSMKPDLGAAAGVGKQGRIGTTGGTLLTQHLLKQKASGACSAAWACCGCGCCRRAGTRAWPGTASCCCSPCRPPPRAPSDLAQGKLLAVEDEADAREMILRHAGKTAAFSRFTDAYNTTQPKPIFAQEEEEEEEGEGEEGAQG
jgi:hypothetical protein